MEIKFRGKRKDSGAWVYGYYFKTPLTQENCNDVKPKDGWFFLSDGKLRHCIATEEGVVYEVLPETVGQLVGVKDKNKVDIYEGDILGYKKWDGKHFVVEWSEKVGNHSVGWMYGFEMPDNKNNWEVIGNVFDNPKLLK